MAVDALTILNPSRVPPFYVNEEQPGLDEALRLKHRYLDLRRPPMQERILMRSRLAVAIRRALDDEGFVEIETPTLIRSTPEGARDFVVPSRLRPGEFYALPQSPQVMKQLLMVAGYDRYFQLAHAYRDEDMRGDRQPEHTQVDIEMSFVTEEDVISTVERVVTRVAKEVVPDRPLLAEPFPRLTYDEAIARYGSDKPDLRFGMELVDLTDVVREVDFRVFAEPIAAGGAVRGIVAPGCGDYSRKQLDELTDLARRHGANGLVHLAVQDDGMLHGPAAKFLAGHETELLAATGAETGDLILIVADADRVAAAEALGHVRLAMGDRLGLRTPGTLAYVWIHRFPMFQWDAEGQRWDATHNPFSAPVPEDADRMEADPASVHAQQYDLALNGWECGGRLDPHPPAPTARARLRAHGPHDRGHAGPVRCAARRARVRRTAPRWHRHRPGPMGRALRGGRQHSRGDGLPEDAVGDRPHARRTLTDRAAAARRAAPSRRRVGAFLEVVDISIVSRPDPAPRAV